MKCTLTETPEFWRLKVPNSRFALHGLAPPLFTVSALFLPHIHGLCASVRPLLTPVSAVPSLPASQFTVFCTSRFTRPRFINKFGENFGTSFQFCVFFRKLRSDEVRWEGVAVQGAVAATLSRYSGALGAGFYTIFLRDPNWGLFLS